MSNATEAIQPQNLIPAVAPCPDTRELAVFLAEFLREWTGTRIEYLGPAKGEPSPLPLELTVRWKGSIGGRMILRCGGGFPSWLLKRRNGGLADPETARKTLDEMAALFVVYFLRYSQEPGLSGSGTLRPRFSTPKDWPTRVQDAGCRILVGPNPLEIRFWIGND